MNNIKKLRQKYGCTQSQLAEIMGCTQSAIAQFENSSKNPSIERAREFINWALITCGDVLTLDDIYPAPVLEEVNEV